MNSNFLHFATNRSNTANTLILTIVHYCNPFMIRGERMREKRQSRLLVYVNTDAITPWFTGQAQEGRNGGALSQNY